jgi:RNA polymerase primary sigma factor
LARQAVLDEFLPLIRRVARHYAGGSALAGEELVQEGVVGLFIALERYDRGLGVPFWGYASWWVRRMMQRLVAEMTLPVVLSDRAMRRFADVKHAQAEHQQVHHREPSNGELVDLTGYTQDQLDSLMCIELCPRSLEEPLQGGDGDAGTLADLLTDPRGEEGYEIVERELDADALRHRPNDLEARERAVLRARYGYDGPAQTLQEVGTELNLTAERVRQIQEHALERLRLAGSTVLSEVVRAYARDEASGTEAGALQGSGHAGPPRSAAE